jgi:flagellar basal-body rod protein FlgB
MSKIAVIFAAIQTITLAFVHLSCQLEILIRGGSMLDKLDAALRFGTEALNLRAQRQEILASNIANADTPGYQARDIDFASQLSKVMQNGRAEGSSLALKVTSSRHIEAQTNSQPSLDLMYRIPDQPAADGNTVDMDRERTQFADNSLKYQTDLTLISSQIKGMMNVLQGQ